MDVEGKILRERSDRIDRTISFGIGLGERRCGRRFKSRPHVHPEIPMKILFASAEAYPLAKVGGLGDVAGSLPKALTALGHDVRIVTVLTIHNLLHQGLFPRELFDWLGLPRDLWTPEGAEFYSQLNFMKAGIVCADLVNTVSPTYAKEIQTPEYGERLDGLLRSRSAKLSGILNGIDYDVWNPAKDPFMPQKYSKSSVEKKRADKAALQKEAGLPPDPGPPLIGYVSRVTAQKGFDILIDALPAILDLGTQFVLLGTGEKKYEDPVSELARTRSDLIVWLKYDEALAHRIYAGSDFFLMPSKFEPCGLGQMISLRYGTIPIVRSTGGLADTVVDVTEHTSKGNGFGFREYTRAALLEAVQRAIRFHQSGRGWKSVVQRGMSADLSWKASARQYVALYEKARERFGTASG